MNAETRVRDRFAESIATKQASVDSISPTIAIGGEIMSRSLLDDGKILSCGNGGSTLTGCGPVDWANATPPTIGNICVSPDFGPVEYSDPALIDLSNTVFGAPCYVPADLTNFLAAFGSSDPEWDLDGDGDVDAEDMALFLSNFC